MRKKDRELIHLTEFQKYCHDFPLGDLEPQEEPDFLIGLCGDKVGIELRDYYFDECFGKGSPSKRQESHRNKIITNVRKAYDLCESPPVNVTITWNENIELSKASHKDIAEKLIKVVKDHIPEPGMTISLGFPNLAWKILPKEIHELWIERSVPQTSTRWDTTGGGALPIVEVKNIEKVIKDKEPKLPKYRESANEIWLLIVASGFSLSAFAKVSAELEGHVFQTSFDKVFFFNFSYSQVLELTISKNNSLYI